MWEYTDKVREFFLRPKNAGELTDADAVGEVGSIVCGDALKLYLRIDRDTDRILDASFQTFGCASAIASSSALTELIKGKTLDEALEVGNRDIAEFLGGLPDQKMHCSVMGREALEAAIANYRGTPAAKPAAEKTVCKCFEVGEDKIRKAALENGLKTVDEITNFTKAGGGCGECRGAIEELLKTIWAEKKAADLPVRPKKPTNLARIALIQEIIESEIRPGLQADGGDVEIIDIDGPKVIVSLRGMCLDCRMSGVTIGRMQARLRELAGDDITVEVQ